MPLPQSRGQFDYPLYFLPGIGCDQALWGPTLRHLTLAAEVHTPAFEGETVEEMAAAVLAQAPARFLLVGHSFGGYVALAMLAAAPQRIAGLVLIATSPLADSPRQARRRRLLLARPEPVEGSAAAFTRLPGRVLAASAAPELHAIAAAMLARTGTDQHRQQQRAAALRHDQQQALGHYGGPLAIVHGGQDRVIPSARAEEMARLVPSATLILLPDCGHLPPLEAPEAVAQTLLLISQAARWRDGGKTK